MPKFAMSVPHALGLEEALRRVRERFHALSETYKDQIEGLQQQWVENVLKFQFTTFGVSVHGTVNAGTSDVKVETELPFMAMMFKGKIERQLRDELDRLLA